MIIHQLINHKHPQTLYETLYERAFFAGSADLLQRVSNGSPSGGRTSSFARGAAAQSQRRGGESREKKIPCGSCICSEYIQLVSISCV